MAVRERHGIRATVGTTLLMAAFAGCLGLGTPLVAQDGREDVAVQRGVISPTYDKFLYHEQRRREAINRQLGTIEDMRWLSGLPPIWHDQIPYRRAAGLDELYAAGWGGFWYQPTWRPIGHPRIFEAWPFVPADLWGYRRDDAQVRQSVGQVQIQTGPRRWESRPVYAEDLTAPPNGSPSAMQPNAAQPAEQQQPSPERPGPREF